MQSELTDSDVFSALADPTQRQLVDWLAEEGNGTATRFAERLPMSRQAVARHLQELEKAGLVDSSRSGRETRFVLRPEPLQPPSVGWRPGRVPGIGLSPD